MKQLITFVFAGAVLLTSGCVTVGSPPAGYDLRNNADYSELNLKPADERLVTMDSAASRIVDQVYN